jgi:hypothetical protein
MNDRSAKAERTEAYNFRELNDLVLHLKGLVLVRGLRARDGAERGELDMYARAIDRLRDQLADVVTSSMVEKHAA